MSLGEVLQQIQILSFQIFFLSGMLLLILFNVLFYVLCLCAICFAAQKYTIEVKISCSHTQEEKFLYGFICQRNIDLRLYVQYMPLLKLKTNMPLKHSEKTQIFAEGSTVSSSVHTLNTKLITPPTLPSLFTFCL